MAIERARAYRYSPREVANAVGVCVETIRRAIRRGELQAHPAGKRGHYWYVLEPDLAAWLEHRLRG